MIDTSICVGMYVFTYVYRVIYTYVPVHVFYMRTFVHSKMSLIPALETKSTHHLSSVIGHSWRNHGQKLMIS